MKYFLLSALFSLLFSSLFAQDKKLPSFEEVLSLRSVGNPSISPNGKHIVFTVSKADWENNKRDTEIWISKDCGNPFPLTNTNEGSSTGPQWSPDGKWIAFRAKRGTSTQIQAIRIAGGEAQEVTHIKGNIGQFRWAPNGKQIAFTMTPEENDTDKKRIKQFGAYAVDDEEYKLSSLHLIDFMPDIPSPNELPCFEKTDSLRELNCIQLPKPRPLIDSADYTIQSFRWSPDGNKIMINQRPDPLINSSFDGKIAILDIDSGNLNVIVDNPGNDFGIDWSPNGQQIIFSSAVEDMESVYYSNNRIFTISVNGGTAKELLSGFDENKSVADWNDQGIFFTAWNKTARNLYKIDPATSQLNTILEDPDMINSVSFSVKGGKFAFTGRENEGLTEVFYSSMENKTLNRLTDISNQIQNWKVAQSEVISWKSEDGTMIEGILHKPWNYDPGIKYPLIVSIHGGPTGISTPSPVPGGVYPILQWLDKGALVLRPNYRGSAGYGGEFRKLNVRNLGVGDAWDVLSGVDYLDQRGLIDTSKMACMGWSQGGYISAFLTTSSKRFKAISVGAGISNWMTYYVNTDIHPFTRQYLKATPWEDEEIYKKTSPMTYINNATTPTLIQHGEFDRRVPIPNAYELLQGLRDVGVPAKLIVYKGFGHGINKPKERLAAVWHNWQWINKYLWGEDVKLPFEE